jgi:hypothetical protein
MKIESIIFDYHGIRNACNSIVAFLDNAGALPRAGVECKRVDAPRMTPSMRTAREDLHLEQIAVVYPGKKRYALGDGVAAVFLNSVVEGMKGLFPRNQKSIRHRFI